MRLDFVVLWIDDQPDQVRSNAGRLRERMRRHGFELQAQIAKSVDDAKDRLQDTVYRDHVDMILVDYDLGAKPHGDEAIKAIRSKLPYREIVFYSARPTRELRKLAFEQDVEGIYCSTRGDLVQVAGDLFEALVKRVVDLDHSRGIVMGATSDIDEFVREALHLSHGSSDSSGQADLFREIEERINKKIAELQETASRIKSAGQLDVALESHELVTSVERLRILAHILKRGTKHDEARKMIVNYMEKVVPRRNMLGHVRLTEQDGRRVLVDRKGKPFDEEDLLQLRQQLLDHRENFIKLVTALKSA